MQGRFRLIPIFAAALAACGSAQAQQSPPAAAPDESIVVTGRVPGKEERIFVDALAAPSRNRQLARFTQPVCPTSFGLSAADDRRLVRRMRRVAAAAGLAVGAEDCRSNVVVLVVPDRRQAISYWRRNRPHFFDGLTPADVRELAEGTGPVAAWQVVHVKGPGGRQIGRAASAHYDYLVVPEALGSRLGSQIQIEFSASFVLVEADALGDASIVQLADYAAMRTFARTDAEAAAAQRQPTILSLFERSGEPVPLSVTQWDLNYLTALYQAPLAAPARDQQRAIARAFLRENAAGQESRAD